MAVHGSLVGQDAEYDYTGRQLPLAGQARVSFLGYPVHVTVGS